MAKSGTNTKTRGELTLRGEDEVEFLGSRAASTPMSATSARTELRALRGRIESLVRHEGREMHEIGTVLNTLYMRHADAALGHGSFRRFLLDEFPGDPRRAYEAMTVARAASVTLATEKGARWVLRATVWTRLEGHGAELASCLTLPVQVGDERGVVLREATIHDLDEAIGRRSVKALDEPAGRKLHRARSRVSELTAKDPAVAALSPTLYLDEGVVVLRTLSRGPEAAKAIRRLHDVVWSTRSPRET